MSYYFDKCNTLKAVIFAFLYPLEGILVIPGVMSSCFSELTVETHRKNIFSKPRARSVVGLVKYAIQNNIISYE